MLGICHLKCLSQRSRHTQSGKVSCSRTQHSVLTETHNLRNKSGKVSCSRTQYSGLAGV